MHILHLEQACERVEINNMHTIVFKQQTLEYNTLQIGLISLHDDSSYSSAQYVQKITINWFIKKRVERKSEQEVRRRYSVC